MDKKQTISYISHKEHLENNSQNVSPLYIKLNHAIIDLIDTSKPHFFDFIANIQQVNSLIPSKNPVFIAVISIFDTECILWSSKINT